MFSKLKTALGALFGGGSDGGKVDTPAAPAAEYKGYRIVAAPSKEGSQFRIAGTIEKDAPDGVKRHEFIRADVYANWDDAVAVTTSKAKQIIDQLGDRMFK
jgi:hypothetical protein